MSKSILVGCCVSILVSMLFVCNAIFQFAPNTGIAKSIGVAVGALLMSCFFGVFLMLQRLLGMNDDDVSNPSGINGQIKKDEGNFTNR